jgi:hypothetical protein
VREFAGRLPYTHLPDRKNREGAGTPSLMYINRTALKVGQVGVGEHTGDNMRCPDDTQAFFVPANFHHSASKLRYH